jgi:hypothetical protein
MHLFTILSIALITVAMTSAVPVPTPAPEPKLHGKELEDTLAYLNAPEPWETSEIPTEILHRLWG